MPHLMANIVKDLSGASAHRAATLRDNHSSIQYRYLPITIYITFRAIIDGLVNELLHQVDIINVHYPILIGIRPIGR